MAKPSGPQCASTRPSHTITNERTKIAPSRAPRLGRRMCHTTRPGSYCHERELGMEDRLSPLVEVARKRSAGRKQHPDRNERAVGEGARHSAHPLALGHLALDRHERRHEEQLAADKKRHRQQMGASEERPQLVHLSAPSPRARQLRRGRRAPSESAFSISGNRVRSSWRMWRLRSAPRARISSIGGALSSSKRRAASRISTCSTSTRTTASWPASPSRAKRGSRTSSARKWRWPSDLQNARKSCRAEAEVSVVARPSFCATTRPTW